MAVKPVWTQRTNPFSATEAITGFAWANLFSIACGDEGTLATASNPESTWTSRTSSFGATPIRGLNFDLGASWGIAVGDSGKIAWSDMASEGATWTQVATTAFGTSNVYESSFAYNAGQKHYVAVGADGKISTVSNNPSGAWTARTSAAGASDIFGVLYTPREDCWICVGAAGKIGKSTDRDGSTWTNPVTTAAFTSANTIRGIAYSEIDGAWVAVGTKTTSDGSVARSTDGGVTWTEVTTPFTLNTVIRKVVWTADGNKFIAVGDGGQMAQSTDGGSTWESVTSGFTDDLYSIFGPRFSRWLAGSNNGKMAYGKNPQRITWTTRTSQFGTDGPNDIAWDGANRIVLVGANAKISTSDDKGSTWTARTSGFTVGNEVESVAYSAAEAQFVITGWDATNRVRTSPTGTTWSVSTDVLGDNGLVVGRSENDDLWLVGGYNAAFESSPSAASSSWTSRTVAAGFPSHIHALVRDDTGDLWVAGSSNNIYTSNDGINWTLRHDGDGSGVIRNIAYSPTIPKWIAVGEGYDIYTSSDAITWTREAQDFTSASNGLSSYSTRNCPFTWGRTGGSIVWDSTNSRFLLSSFQLSEIAESPDGVVWTTLTDTLLDKTSLVLRCYVLYAENGNYIHSISDGTLETGVAVVPPITNQTQKLITNTTGRAW